MARNRYLENNEPHHYKRDTDAEEIRKTFGIPPWRDREREFSDYEYPLPNAIVHTKDGDRWGHSGGTNWFAVGKKDAGKTTLGLWLAPNLMEANDETVVWRGSETRSEWLPLKHWTTLYLPAGCEIEPRWVPEDVTRQDEAKPADLDSVVRDVYRYDGLRDLLDQLEQHQFAVVYPDPQFRECNEIMRESSYVQEEITYTPVANARDTDDTQTPLIHWWVAFAVARLEGWSGMLDWTSLIFDEVADLLPQSARANQNQTYEKMEVMRKVMADSRKYRFSVFAFGQDETNLHEKIRRTFDWRVSMPDELGNRCQSDDASAPVGFTEIPMKYNMLKRRSSGYGICWTPAAFTRFTWENVPDWEEDQERHLKISIRDSPRRARVTDSAGASPDSSGRGGKAGVGNDD